MNNCVYRNLITVILSLCEILLFGGIPLGWFSIVFTLKQDEVFEDLCSNERNNSSEEIDCFRQDERFNLYFSLGMAISTSMAVVLGQLYFKYSFTFIRIFTIFKMVAGLLCFGFVSPELPWLSLPGIILVGVAGLSLMLSNIHKAAVLLPTAASVYIGLLSGCFDSSLVTVMAVKALYENGVRRLFSFIGVSVLLVIVSGMCTLMHAKSRTKIDTPNAYGVNKMDTSTITIPSRWNIVRSPLYVLSTIWFSIVQLRYFCFIGSANRFLGQVLQNDDVEVSYYTDVMTYTMLGGVISSFCAGYLMEIQKKWFTGPMKSTIPLTVTSGLAVLLSFLTFVPTKSALYADFVVVTFFRSFIYSTQNGFVINTFPLKYTSFLVGLEVSVSGMIALVQYPLFTWTQQYDDAITHVNAVLLCLSVISLLLPMYIFLNHRRGRYVNVTEIKANRDMDST